MVRRLRLATFILCVVALTASIFLWFRSYARHDALTGHFSSEQVFLLISAKGRMNFETTCMTDGDAFFPWGIESRAIHAKNRLQPIFAFHAVRAQTKPVRTILRTIPVPTSAVPGQITGASYAITIPHWFAVVVSGMTIAFFGTSNGRRYTLSRLLLVTAFVSVVLGTAVWAEK
jgi:hypothetical protein